ncbi:MAG: sigma-70 family RNA polymerase sigma factor [Pirellulales bacterium]
MNDPQTTRVSLLLRLQDKRDERTWREFVELYSPLIYGFARRQGLQDADAVDVTQEVLGAVARSIERFSYDATRGSFRGWLFTLTRNELCDWRARQRSAVIGKGGCEETSDAREPALDEFEECWEDEFQRHVFLRASERVRAEVRESTWEAFRRTTMAGESGREVAQALGMTIAAVYLAKARVLTRLRVLAREIAEEYT